MEQPTVSRIQTLLMITGHSWGAGEGRRAWMFLGMAVRGAQVIGLFQESGPALTREEFILAEERRRTAWTCFLMDSLLSGGKGRRRGLAAEDMQIQLPCDTGYFYFGEPVRCQKINETEEDLRAVRMASQGRLDIGNIGIVGYTMQVADTWGAVARWACSTTEDLPWERASEYQTLMRSLERWRTSLPSRLAYSVSSLHAHSASDQGQAFCYMHSVYFMCLMFLNRSYLQSLPEVEPRKRAPSGSELERRWHQWELQSKKELLAVSNQVCEMLYEMRNFGLFFLRGLVPWIGFTAYTATGIMLYYYHFPDQNEKSNAMSQARDHVVQGCMFLKDMKGSWPMADTWRETIKQMQIYYSNIKTKGEQSITQNERREMRNAIVDYGALQPSPVHSSSENEGGPAAGLLSKLKLQYITSAASSSPVPMPNAATIQTPVTLPSLQNSPLSLNPNSPMPSHQHQSPMPSHNQQQQQHHPRQSSISHSHHSPMPFKRSPSPSGESPNMGSHQHQQQMTTVPGSGGYQTVEIDFLSPGFDMFEMDFNINDEDLESAIADAAQGFWNDFPGEVEVV
ncbi:hypothetical protein E2P81_ATG05476 [Venturia nashicola]|nr:hypothetical protein E2P81_ATG05476 [Venturia nashicola]